MDNGAEKLVVFRSSSWGWLRNTSSNGQWCRKACSFYKLKLELAEQHQQQWTMVLKPGPSPYTPNRKKLQLRHIYRSF
ncbi:hypothetical protein GOBAR_AA28164 [Gossypium barbadense]|uniref:Uncharacterized protein n=1 Tax=Gossypium barbadense TaxID=3634 RepID=A0A2P5WN44_GOSBA|nr:hypothetical protein GOBAR_AA28164 [Gossypium barbadense]